MDKEKRNDIIFWIVIIILVILSIYWPQKGNPFPPGQVVVEARTIYELLE